MNKFLLGAFLAGTFALPICAQVPEPQSNDKIQSVKALENLPPDFAGVVSILAELQAAINVQKLNVGDLVHLRISKSERDGHKDVIEKDSIIIGRVAEISLAAKDIKESKATIVFDKLQRKGREVAIDAAVMSITQPVANAHVLDDDVFASTSGGGMDRNSGRTPTSSNPAGGGIRAISSSSSTSTVGAMVKDVNRNVGTVDNQRAEIRGTTNVSGLLIINNLEPGSSGGTTLFQHGGNLKLSKGSTFGLRIAASAYGEAVKAN